MDVDPAIGEYFPSMHTLQSVDWSVFPLCTVYVPAGHNKHCNSDVAAKISENLPAPQMTQSVAAVFPEEVRYFPASHDWQNASSPAASTPEYFPGTQLTQVNSSTAPVMFECLPFTQLVHAPSAI
jgi:hypothetical protein